MESVKTMAHSFVIESLEQRQLFAGVTIFATGRLGGTNGWMATMASAITAKAGGAAQVPEYLLSINEDTTTTNLVASISHIAGTGTPQASSSGEILVLVDYYNVSANASYSSTYIGQMIANVLMHNPVDGVTLASLPIHEIGVSRGTALFDGANRVLGQAGVWVDQETNLDPNPIAAQGDPPSVLYDNVEFVDNYWRNDGSTSQINDGHAVNGAYNLNVYWLDSESSGYVTPHLAPAGYYVGTIDQTATYSGEGPIYSEWYGNTPTMPARNATGWIYSALSGAPRPLSGVWAASGGTGARTVAGQVGSQWGNVADLAVTSGYSVGTGDTMNVSFLHEDRDSSDTTTFYLDTDRNPYNGSFAANLGSFTLGQSGSPANGTETLSMQGIAPGTYWLCAKTADAAGNVRYTYSPITKPLSVHPSTTAAGGNSAITGHIFNDAIGSGVFYTGESAVAGVTVFADLNGSSQIEPGDPTGVTDANGDYSISGLASGVSFYVGQLVPSGFRQTTGPTDPVTVNAGQTLAVSDFGDTQTAKLSGDVLVSSTTGVPATGTAGFLIKLTEKPKKGKALTFTTVTAADGSYSFNGLAAGDKDTVQIIKRKGFKLARKAKASAVVTLTIGQVLTGVTFSQVAILPPVHKQKPSNV
jgi:hypothetical protein